MSLILTREALANQIADDLATRNANSGLIEGEFELKADKTALATTDANLASSKLVVAQHENEIDDLSRTVGMMNPTGASKILVSDYGNVAVPITALEGQGEFGLEGGTATNLVDGADVAIDGTVTFASVLDAKYYDSLHGAFITGTGSDIVVTNDSGVIANMMIISLTATGQTALTLANLAKIYSRYFADTASVSGTGAWESLGKNLFDYNTMLNPTLGYVRLSDGEFVANPAYQCTNFFKISAGTYYWPEDCGGVRGHCWYDINKTFIGGVQGVKTFTIPQGASFIRLNSTLAKIPVTAQLELGSVATPYEAFRNALTYHKGADLLSVPSAKDTYSVVNGRMVRTQSVSIPVAVASGVAVNVTNYPLAKTGGNFVNVITAGGEEVGIVGTDSTTAIGSLRFELATPIITDVETSGLPVVFPNGSVRHLSRIADLQVYGASCGIYDSDYPIVTLQSVFKMDYDTGLLVELDIADATIASDGLTFTHTGLTDGDMVVFEYNFANPKPEGKSNITYLNSKSVIADTTDGNYYTWKPIIENGVITGWTTEEVV